MEVKSTKLAMVSRLPKFGVRPTTGATSPLSNGITQTTPPPQDSQTTPTARTNGVVRASSFSLKWMKNHGSAPTISSSPDSVGCSGDRQQNLQTQRSPGGRELKKPSLSTPKVVRKSGSSVSSTSSPKAIPHQATKTSPKSGPREGQRAPARSLPKACQNGAAAGSELVRPRASSSSPCSSSRDSLSQSSDSLKSLTLDNMVRSQSFTHFKQIPSPTSLPMARSFSFNRAVELAKPLANTQLQTPRTQHIKPSQLGNGRLGTGLGVGIETGLGGLQYHRSPSSVCSPCTTPGSMKKHLLPNCVLRKPSAPGYRLTHPGQAKKHKPLFTGSLKVDMGAGLMGDKDTIDPSPLTLTPDPPVDSDMTPGEQLGGTGEGLEDTSLSSASSLSRADTSEEFLDDSDNLGDGDRDTDDVSDRRMSGGFASQTRLRSFLDETLDWAGMGLSGQKERLGVGASFGILTPERGDFLQGSSQDLSQLNSSGATYMWDEEVLEPLGPPSQHPCEIYNQSDHFIRMDIRKNVDNQEPADLEYDDLMLDVDLDDNSSHHNGLSPVAVCGKRLDAARMAHCDRSERGGGSHWKRRHHRRNVPDAFHNDMGPVFQQCNGSVDSGRARVGPRLQSVRRRDANTGPLDELTLKHMAQDCSSVKNQLLKLKSLLQMEDGGPEIEDSEEDNAARLQLEELTKEVRVLREELRDKDRTICQLTRQQQQLQQQVPGRCHCHQRAASFRGDLRTQHDKATQTPWRGQGHSHAGMLPAPLSSPWQSQYQGSPRTTMSRPRHTSNTTGFQPQQPRSPHPGKTSKNSPHRGPQ
ncbi:hypothetical protein UPYG_G00324580 [Umbra pygmaea]|uniref:Serine-rich coiled-coil domain-containing protein 2-like n=1 Tax=Umbra pygmaea TaxID=75934 RepID=A0ABD0WLD4_UMBPY